MRDEHIIQRQGKSYVLYPGLLNEAHERFDVFTIETTLIDAGEHPIVQARFKGWLKDVPFQAAIKTSGIGTAGRGSDRKGPAVDAPIEMAETRAKARALRDAVNIGETAFEELPSESSASEGPQPASNIASKPPNSAPKPRQGSNPTPTPPGASGLSAAQFEGAATEKIKKSTLSKLEFMVQTYEDATGRERGEVKQSFEGELGCKLSELAEESAQVWIQRYQRALEKLERGEEA